MLSTRTPSRTFGRNFSPTKEELEGDNTTFVPKAESSSTAPTTTTTSRTTSRTTKPEAELSFQEKLRRRFQKFRQSTVRRLFLRIYFCQNQFCCTIQLSKLDILQASKTIFCFKVVSCKLFCNGTFVGWQNYFFLDQKSICAGWEGAEQGCNC